MSDLEPDDKAALGELIDFAYNNLDFSKKRAMQAAGYVRGLESTSVIDNSRLLKGVNWLLGTGTDEFGVYFTEPLDAHRYWWRNVFMRISGIEYDPASFQYLLSGVSIEPAETTEAVDLLHKEILAIQRQLQDAKDKVRWAQADRAAPMPRVTR